MANSKVRGQFTMLEKSLRATGSDLPLAVIPYDDNRFELPQNSYWLENDPLYEWLGESNAFAMCRKYACLLDQNYLHVDTDVMFLRDPEDGLRQGKGFVTFDGHWRNPNHTVSPISLPYHRSHSTNWQKNCFNAGQFACESKLFDSLEELKQFVESHPAKGQLLTDTKIWKDQNALNLFILLKGPPVQNLTLPPFNLESSWAGDYEESGFEDKYWKKKEKMPFMIHWAGRSFEDSLAINELPKAMLSSEEWRQVIAERPARKVSVKSRLKNALRGMKSGWDG